jgi:hypothetical protein
MSTKCSPAELYARMTAGPARGRCLTGVSIGGFTLLFKAF